MGGKWGSKLIALKNFLWKRLFLVQSCWARYTKACLEMPMGVVTLVKIFLKTVQDLKVARWNLGIELSLFPEIRAEFLRRTFRETSKPNHYFQLIGSYKCLKLDQDRVLLEDAILLRGKALNFHVEFSISHTTVHFFRELLASLETDPTHRLSMRWA